MCYSADYRPLELLDSAERVPGLDAKFFSTRKYIQSLRNRRTKPGIKATMENGHGTTIQARAAPYRTTFRPVHIKQ